MPKIKAVSPILYNKLRDTGEVFDVPDALAKRLVANGAAVIYTEPNEGAATKAPPPATPKEEEPPKPKGKQK